MIDGKTFIYGQRATEENNETSIRISGRRLDFEPDASNTFPPCRLVRCPV
jgi:hypothetical protein